MSPTRCRETINKFIGRQRYSNRGFTLLELMVVIVVVGVLVSIFTLSVGSVTEDETVEHSRRLEALLSVALEEAGIQGREFGLRFYQSGYEFSILQPFEDKAGKNQWVWIPLDNDKLFKPRDFGDDIRVDLEIEGKSVVLEFERSEDMFDPSKLEEDEDEDDADEAAENSIEAAYKPQIFLFSSGDIEPTFQARIRGAFDNRGIVLTVADDGGIEVIPDEF